MTPPELKPIVAIVGPTASGKSALSMSLVEEAKRHGHTLEIISMDSALVYKGMDIGTAKPSIEERTQVAHYGIDICEPWQTYSAANFANDALAWAHDIRQRGNIPLIVGGTMLYWRALTQGLTQLPPADPQLRADLEKEADEIGWEGLHRRLCELDPVTGQRLHPSDTQRIERALEVILLTGKPMSELIAENPYSESRDDATLAHTLFSLEPDDRSWLHERIAFRFHQMLEQGFLDEMKQLMKNPAIHEELPSMRAVGYRQAWEYLSEKISYDEFINKGIAATRQLAKRQLTWLRAMPSRLNFDPSKPEKMKAAREAALSTLLKNR